MIASNFPAIGGTQMKTTWPEKRGKTVWTRKDTIDIQCEIEGTKDKER